MLITASTGKNLCTIYVRDNVIVFSSVRYLKMSYSDIQIQRFYVQRLRGTSYMYEARTFEEVAAQEPLATCITNTGTGEEWYPETYPEWFDTDRGIMGRL